MFTDFQMEDVDFSDIPLPETKSDPEPTDTKNPNCFVERLSLMINKKAVVPEKMIRANTIKTEGIKNQLIRYLRR